MSLMAVAEGAAMITESIFENRFMHVPELCRMGADSNVHGASAMVGGYDPLNAAAIACEWLRLSFMPMRWNLATNGLAGSSSLI